MNVQKALKMNAFGIRSMFVWVWVFHRTILYCLSSCILLSMNRSKSYIFLI